MLPERDEIATLVVCEDDAATLELLCDHLFADRFGGLPAPSASDALRLCSYNQPDLLLLDLTLPDAAGLDVLREIREADGMGAARPAAAGHRPHWSWQRSRSQSPRPRLAGRRLFVKPFRYPELRRGSDAVLAVGLSLARARAESASSTIDPGAPKNVRSATARWPSRRRSSPSSASLPLSIPTRVFTKAELLRRYGAIAAGLGTEDARFRHRASRLRRKLDPEHGRYVINCWGMGYRLVDG